MNTEQSIAKSNEDEAGRATHERERASEVKDATVHELEVPSPTKAETAADAKAETAADAKAEIAADAKAETDVDAKAETAAEGEHAPVSASELVADSVRDRELEPVSLRDIELILSPGKAPPPIAAAANADGKPRVPAAPRKRLPSLPTAPLKKHHEPVTRGEDSALDDLRALAGLSDDKGHENKVDLAAIMEMGSTTGTDARLSHPEIPRESDPPPPPAPVAPRGKPRPPLRSRPSIPDEQEVAGASAASALADGIVEIAKPGETSDATPTRPKSIPPPLPTSAKTPSKAAPSVRPGVKSSAPAAAQSIEPRSGSSRTLWIAGAVALIAGGVGYFARGGADPTAGAISTATAATTVVSQAPEGKTTPTPADTASKDDASAPVSTEIAAVDAAPTAAAASTGKLPSGAATTTVATTPAVATTTETAAVATATATATATTTAEPPPPPAGAEFDKAAASAALGAAVGSASGCKQPGDPSGMARVQITFVPSGRVTTANVAGPPFAGTATGSCIARAFKSASVPPFSGDPVTVSKSVSIP